MASPKDDGTFGDAQAERLSHLLEAEDDSMTRVGSSRVEKPPPGPRIRNGDG